MKTIVLNSDNRSIILCDDTDVVSVESNHVKRNDERIYGIGSDTVTLQQADNAPADWSASKYFFADGSWTLNPDWVDPESLS